MNISKAISNYCKQLSTGKTKAQLTKDITVNDQIIPKGTVSCLFFQKDNGKYHFENSSLDIAFEIEKDEFSYME